jgi:hypothetical protein
MTGTYGIKSSPQLSGAGVGTGCRAKNANHSFMLIVVVGISMVGPVGGTHPNHSTELKFWIKVEIEFALIIFCRSRHHQWRTSSKAGVAICLEFYTAMVGLANALERVATHHREIGGAVSSVSMPLTTCPRLIPHVTLVAICAVQNKVFAARLFPRARNIFWISRGLLHKSLALAALERQLNAETTIRSTGYAAAWICHCL